MDKNYYSYKTFNNCSFSHPKKGKYSDKIEHHSTLLSHKRRHSSKTHHYHNNRTSRIYHHPHHHHYDGSHLKRRKYYYNSSRHHSRRTKHNDDHCHKRRDRSRKNYRDRNRDKHYKKEKIYKKYNKHHYKYDDSSIEKSLSKDKSSSSSSNSSKSDKGHYNFKIGEIVNHKYQLLGLLGDGTFGRVIECQNIHNKKIFAMKIIRPVERYIESARIETAMIQLVNQKDTKLQSHCINVIDSFTFHSGDENYFAIVFNKVGLSLFDFIKMNNYRGYSINEIQSFAKQIFEGIGYLHSIGIIHTDLKPENILLLDSSFERISKRLYWPSNVLFKEEKYKSLSPSTQSYSKERDEYYCKVIQKEIKIIDFGGAVYTTDDCTSIINTRQYRSPEVILECCRWDEKSDVWSIACILAELYTGELLFSTHDNEEHLCLIEKVCGKFPYWMGQNASYHLRHLFNLDDNKEKRYVNILPEKLKNKEKVLGALKQQEYIEDFILNEHRVFQDFLKYLLVIDPKKRPSCIEALDHNFFKYKF